MIIAVDGPAAAGKGTLSRRLASEFLLAYLDTGLLYRMVAAKLISRGADPCDENAAFEVARSIGKQMLPESQLRTQDVGAVASIIATQEKVRSVLLKYQREFAEDPPGYVRGAVLDGRDIGSVVFPEADVKIFVTASQEARGERRYRELLARGVASIRAQVLQEIRERDERDCCRQLSPLIPTEGAFLLDTTLMSADSAFEAARLFVGQV
jgi:cytidylate kinase